MRPTGTVTFLFTDIEASSRSWEEHPAAIRVALERHDDVLRRSITEHDGIIFATGGDGVAAAFTRAIDGTLAAIEGQRLLHAQRWPEPLQLRVRMGLHTGEADERNGDYFGPVLNRAARLMAVGHGGQILVSDATRAVLQDRLGKLELIELGEFVLKDLSTPERIHQLVADDLPSVYPPPRTWSARAQNLPLQLTSFIGRESDVVDLVANVRANRLVTLIAAGGSGKTRLAVQTAAEFIDGFAGVYLVELAPVAEVGMVGVRVLDALGIPAPPDSATVDDTLVERIGDRRLLLVIDNCEHLIGECARLVTHLLMRCPNLRVLATSREMLTVPGEHVVPVAPLAIPASDAGVEATMRSPAAALFVDRAQALDDRFVVTPSNAAAVRDICRRLDGIPLALELAAARVHAISVEDLAARLDDAIHVVGGIRAGETRHRTLIACLDWSYQLLDHDEATLLHRLAVFAGGCTLDAAEVVCAGAPVATVDDSIARLVDKSLVIADRSQSRIRYRLLEVVRQFALERLEATGEADDIRARHLDWYVDMVRTSAPRLSGADIHVVRQLMAEADNLSAAIAYALRTNATVALVRLLGGGGHMWAHARMMGQLASWWRQVLPLLPEAPDTSFPPNRLASSLASAGAALMNVRNFDEARTCFDRSRRLSGVSDSARGLVAFLIVSLEGLAGAPPSNVISLAESLRPQAVEVPLTLGSVLAQWLLLTGDHKRAGEVLDDLLAHDGEADTTSWGAFARTLRGLADVMKGRVDAGLRQIDEIRNDVTSTDVNWLYPQICWIQGMAQLLVGRDHEAATASRDALIASRDWGITWGLPYAVELGALTIDHLGNHKVAARCLGAVEAAYASAGGRPPSGHPGTFLHACRVAMDHHPQDLERGHLLTIQAAAEELLRGLSSTRAPRASVDGADRGDAS